MGDVTRLPIGAERGWRYLEPEYRKQLLRAGANPKKVDEVLAEMRGHYEELDRGLTFTWSVPGGIGLTQAQVNAISACINKGAEDLTKLVRERHYEALAIILILTAQKHGALNLLR